MRRNKLENAITRIWYRPGSLLDYLCIALLFPFSILFYGLVLSRRACFRSGIFKSYRLNAYVVVVGNLSVGGTGKTPFTLALCSELKAAKLPFGIVSRGYGGSAPSYPLEVALSTSPAVCGDEPYMIKQAVPEAPVFVGPDRVAATKALLNLYDVRVIVCDDGLQHYRLKRDAEFVVVDGQRRWGNGMMLPAGPLREPPSRAKNSITVVNTATPEAFAEIVRSWNKGSRPKQLYPLMLEPVDFVNLRTGEVRSVSSFVNSLGKNPILAVAGIGNPERYFATLRQLGLSIECQAFPDHHAFTSSDFKSVGNKLLLMTEKDAVKCKAFASDFMWYLRVASLLDKSLVAHLLEDIKSNS